MQPPGSRSGGCPVCPAPGRGTASLQLVSSSELSAEEVTSPPPPTASQGSAGSARPVGGGRSGRAAVSGRVEVAASRSCAAPGGGGHCAGSSGSSIHGSVAVARVRRRGACSERRKESAAWMADSASQAEGGLCSGVGGWV